MKEKGDDLPQYHKGQTVIDFAIAASIFLMVVGGVLLYTPTIFAPLSESTTAETIAADKTATHISKELIAGEESQTNVDTICTIAFFSGNGSLDEDCTFSANNPIQDIVGLKDTTEINVYITDTQQTNDPPITTTEFEGKEYTLQRKTKSDAHDVAVATRIINIDGNTQRLTVEVW